MSEKVEPIIQYINGISYKLKEPFDFSFLSEYGKVFKIFDEQSSGCICFGVTNGKNKFFELITDVLNLYILVIL